MSSAITIMDFDATHQPGVDALLAGIQDEFPEQIYAPGGKKMTDMARLAGSRYWVAMDGGRVVGTVGVLLLGNDNAALKSMMLQKEYRGKETQLADVLLETVLAYAREMGTKVLYLGTMVQFHAAQRFYVRHGFTEIGMNELPGDFIWNPVDKVFFRLQLVIGGR